MALTRPIPQDTRNQLSTFPEYARCNVADVNCLGRIQWHHHFVYAGKRTDDPFGIIAICAYHHDHLIALVRRKLDAIMMARVTDEIRVKYHKAVWPKE
jgi:hypothetical protein